MHRVRTIGSVALLWACGGQPNSSRHESVGGPPGLSAPQAQPVVGHQLNDVQLDCRSKWMGDIAESNDVWGPTCASDTMRLAVQTFDLGSLHGFLEAQDQAHLVTMFCMCAANPCPPDFQAKLDRDLSRLADDPDKAERDHVAVITNEALRVSNCFDASVTLHLYKKGYTCGYVDGSVSPTLRHQMQNEFSKVPAFAQNADALANACWTKWTSSRAPS